MTLAKPSPIQVRRAERLGRKLAKQPPVTKLKPIPIAREMPAEPRIVLTTAIIKGKLKDVRIWIP